MEVVISDEVKAAFGDLRLAYLEIDGMRIGTDSDHVTNLLRDVATKASQTLTLDTVKDRSDFRAYRDFFWKLGVDPTKTRPAAEALVRRILKSASMPRINDFVDAYNLASIETGVPVAAFDLEALEDDIVLRLSRAGEEFLGIGMTGSKPLGGGILVMSSGSDLIAMYPYRDADASKITLETRDATLIACGVPGIGMDILQEAAGRSRDNVIAVCGGHPSKLRIA